MFEVTVVQTLLISHGSATYLESIPWKVNAVDFSANEMIKL